MKSKLRTLGVASLLAVALASCGGTTTTAAQQQGTTGAPTSAPTSTPTEAPIDNWYNYSTDANAISVGEYSLKAASAETRKDILGQLEGYASFNFLTGISLFENGGYVMYNPRIQKGTESYISGYGFGILGEGDITADLETESNAAWKRYYHTYESEDPGHINYANDKGSVVGGLIGYIGGSYWTSQMNATKDGYDWVGELAKGNRPVAVNPAEDGTSTTFEFEVKVGDELKYNTLTTNEKLAKYKGQKVTIDDYLTMYKLTHCQKIGWERAADGLENGSGIAGMFNYYNATADGLNEEAWANVGLKKVGDNKLQVTFNEATTPFYAMYYLASSMYAPVPMEFIKELGNGDVYEGAKAYQSKTDSGLTPVDTSLSTGAYVLESWDDQAIVFKKNDLMDTGNRYKIKGVHIRILPAIATDNEAALKEFLAGNIDACGIPMTRLSEFKDDPRTTTTTGDSVFKLNVNTCDEAMWEYLFGENGTICETPKEDYWAVEPAMSNKDFVRGISYAINRDEFAANRGSIPSCNYFSSNYLIDPENGISWNVTQQHADAIAPLTDGTEYGYSLTLAKSYFKRAADKLIADKVYKDGDTIEIEICWQYPQHETQYGADIEAYLEDAFNDCGTTLKLDVVNTSVTTWSDVYYYKMMIGQYDIAFGSISGNAYDPLNFMEVLKSDNSSGFTLNWGTDTSVVSDMITIHGANWSFDCLWEVADTRAVVAKVVKDGKTVIDYYDEEATYSDDTYFDAIVKSSVHNEDGTRTVVIDTHSAEVEGKTVVVGDLVLSNGTTVTLDANGSFVLDAATEKAVHSTGLTLTVNYTVNGNAYTEVLTVVVAA